MNTRKSKTFVGDFETVTYKGQESTEVWASALVELNSEDVKIFHSLEETLNYLIESRENYIIYYHNLKFDGSFWLYYLKSHPETWTQAGEKTGDGYAFYSDKDMPLNSYKYLISELGLWYSIVIKYKTSDRHFKYIEIRDSLKLLPFSVKRIGESFGTKHKKLNMEYEGKRYSGCEITEEERQYIKNDVLVIKEALEITFSEGHKNLTIGSCCLSEYKHIITNDNFKEMFPNIYEIELDADQYGAQNAGEYVRKSYRGGWTYLVPEKANKVFNNGITLDVNSLYPSMMHSDSGNVYPIGLPTFWSGNYIPDFCLQDNIFYFVRIKVQFDIKPGYLPFITINHNPLYNPKEKLKTSSIKVADKSGKQLYKMSYTTFTGLQQNTVEITLTKPDFLLFQQHYNIKFIQILDGCYFAAKEGIFDEYINKYKEIKMTSKGARRELAKLFLNNLYGKMATSVDSSFKLVEIVDGVLKFFLVREKEKTPGYIPVGSAITSYSRCFTIRAAQANYYGQNEVGFIYADTDSIHCDISEKYIKGVSLHDTNFCNWKCETKWETAIFVREKSYIETTRENGNLTYNIKCAGMPQKSKDLLSLSLMEPGEERDRLLAMYSDKLEPEEISFIEQHRTIRDFKIGLEVPGKLTARQIKGGVALLETPYKMHA